MRRSHNLQAFIATASITRPVVLCGILLLALTFERVFADDPGVYRLTPQEKRGKQIYLRGSSSSGEEITATLGNNSITVPATTMACANCHGLDGLGKSEGGITPPNITWENLTKSYDVSFATGRKRPAYTERSIGRAITDGVDSIDNKLHLAMPRYRMSPQDLSDLISYLKRLGKDKDPGLTETTIKVGTILPMSGPLAEMGQAVDQLMRAYFAEINEQGKLFGRKIELQAIESSDAGALRRAGLERFIKSDELFAIVGAYTVGADKEIISLVEDQEIPLVGPLTLSHRADPISNRHVFYLYSGIKEQAGALAKFSSQKMKAQNPRVVVIHPETEAAVCGAEVVEQYFNGTGRGVVSRLKYLDNRFDAALLADELTRQKADAIFFFGSGEQGVALLKEMGRLQLAPEIFAPGSLIAKDIIDAGLNYKGKIHLSFPVLPSDQSPVGAAEYRFLAEKYKLPARHLTAQISAYCAAKIFVEGLKRAGKDLSREKLILALERLYDFDTDLTRPITYGPNQRIGAPGAYVVLVNLEARQFIPISGWVTPD